MPTQKEWESEKSKAERLEVFSKHREAFLGLIGIVIALVIIALYYYKGVKPLEADLAGLKVLVTAIILGFSASAAATGMFVSLYAGSVNLKVLGMPPDASDRNRGLELVSVVEKSKGELKHYFQIAAVLLFLNVFKDVIGLFIG